MVGTISSPGRLQPPRLLFLVAALFVFGCNQQCEQVAANFRLFGALLTGAYFLICVVTSVLVRGEEPAMPPEITLAVGIGGMVLSWCPCTVAVFINDFPRGEKYMMHWLALAIVLVLAGTYALITGAMAMKRQRNRARAAPPSDP